MTVTKILEQTLSAGSTSVSFTDADIPNSLIRVYSSNSDLIPVSRILSGNTLTVTYEAQTNAIDVAVEIVKAGLDIVDNLTSTDADKALSAKQGNLLNIAIKNNADNIQTLSDNLDTLSGNLDTLSDRVDNLDIPDNITDLDDVIVSNIQSGQVLAWDGIKFVNVNQSGDKAVHYSTDEEVIGTWLGETLYRKTLYFQSGVSISMAGWTDVNSDIPNIGYSQFIRVYSMDSNGTYQGELLCGLNASNHVQMQSTRNGSASIVPNYITLEYTKTS